MKLVHRYILRELLVSMAVSIPVLNFVLMMEKIMKLSRILSSVGASPREMFSIILYTQPELLLVTIPMAFLLSVLYTYGKMNADNELMIVKASGMPFRQAAIPAFMLGMLCIIIGLFVSFRLEPAGKRAVRTSVSATLEKRAPGAIEPGVFNLIIKDVVVYAREKTDDRLDGLFIYDQRKPDRPVVIYAGSGQVTGAPQLGGLLFRLKNGLVHITKGSRLIEIFFGDYNLVLPLSLEEPAMFLGELTPGELLAQARTTPGEPGISRWLELYRRITFPLFNLAVMLLAPVLALYSGKRARLGGLAMGTMVFSAYYIALSYSERLADSGKVPPAVGGWSPLVLFLIISWLLFFRADKR
ncbi:MAG: LptF/LptG family permease [Nitrospiraceae bacterium]|nr:LptF/LptG family permease [Nitrospiraceae bacterium]